MAIFGDLGELPFPEVLSTLGRRSGVLRVSPSGGRHEYELHLDNDHLLALFVDRSAVRDVLALREIVLDLARAAAGRFEFQRMAALDRQHDLSITRLLLSTSTIIDELDHYRTRLPAPDTRFVLLSAADEQGLDPDLASFVGGSRDTLLVGASAQQIADARAMHVERVQLSFYKLRTAGLLVPLRAHAAPAPTPAPPRPAPAFGAAPALAAVSAPSVSAPPAPPAPRESPGLVSRLLGALRSRRWFA